MLPKSLEEPIRRALAALGDVSAVTGAKMVAGGCINNGMQLSTHQSHYFVKWNNLPLPGMFEAEALGLKYMRETDTVRVPQVLAVGARTDDHPAFLLLEWVEAGVSKRSSEKQHELGQQVALMHRCRPREGACGFGLEINNYIGSSEQRNDWTINWIRFFGEQRLAFQCKLAVKNGLMPAGRRKKLDRLIERLDDILGVHQPRQAALLHGDLWGGNVIPGPDGLVLIDPAVYYGDREAELAFTELFGGFTAEFYQGYEETYALDSGYSQRRDVYNLYHLLNHLNLFGEGYGSQVDGILRRYTG